MTVEVVKVMYYFAVVVKDDSGNPTSDSGLIGECINKTLTEVNKTVKFYGGFVRRSKQFVPTYNGFRNYGYFNRFSFPEDAEHFKQYVESLAVLTKLININRFGESI